ALFNASQKYIENYEKRHGSLKVTCIRVDEPMKLDEIYTAVQLLDRSELGYFESLDTLESLYRESGRRRVGFDSDRKQQGIEVANQEHYLMVLGGPGVGKSTFLRKVGLEALKAKDGTFQHACIPVFLALQRFNSSDVTVNQLIVNEFATCGFPEPEAFTQAHLKRGRLLILFDGLDEVPPDCLDHAITQIKNFVDQNDTNRFIASCRVAAYKGGFTRFKDVAMVAFENEQIEDFIRKWFRSAKDCDANTADQCWELLNRPEYKAAKELAQTPLLLTLLCAVYDKSIDFPKNRASLYGEALDVLLKEWAAEKRIQRDPIYQELSIELERELLAEIAYDSFVEDQLFFGKKYVPRRIKEFLVSNLNAPKHLDSEQVLEAIEVQQGIFVERARDTYSFSHLTFQEYLTAQFIVDNRQIDWLAENHLTDEGWREVFLLVAGLMPGRRGADDLLSLMEREAKTRIATPKLHQLLHWADEVTQGSDRNYKPVAKRTIAIYLVCFLELALNGQRTFFPEMYDYYHLEFGYNLALSIDIILDRESDDGLFEYVDRFINPSTLCITFEDLRLGGDHLRVKQEHNRRKMERNLVGAMTGAVMSALHLVRQLEEIKLFETNDLKGLMAQLEDLSREVSRGDYLLVVPWELTDRIRRFWFDALPINSEILELLSAEKEALKNYFYANELMVRCKEAAVRVSPQVWEGIEERMVTVP
ncbi:MAG TPA: NACHT domain-containing protein, partial [Elainellaceae cyanobacterium]